MGSPVSLVSSTPDPRILKDSVAKAVELIGFKTGPAVKTVVIKPNLNYYWEPATGCTTDPRVVAALIDFVRERYGKDLSIRVAEADASAMRTKHVFKMLRYEELAEEKKVELINLSKDALTREKVTVGGHDMEFDVPKSLVEADLFINVPKPKIMRATKMTCAMKNIFGCIAAPRKIAYHAFLNEAIVGINKLLKPNLTIVDGLVALGRFPVKLGLIMAGSDAFSVDWVAAQIMGYNPRSVRFLKIAMREKLGEEQGISVVGEPLKGFRKKFPRESFLFQRWVWSLQFGILRAYRKVSGDVIPPFLEG